jgi:hypothetical protein
MEKLRVKQIINAYNEWVKFQRITLRQRGVFCPYYSISLNTIQKFTPNDKRKLGNLRKTLPKLFETEIVEIVPVGEKLWNEILSQGYYGEKRKWKTPTGIKFRSKKISERINPPDIKFTTKLHIDRDFVSLCKQKGLYVSPYQFRWYENNKIIYPLLKWKNKNYYSIFQIYILDYIEIWKEETLGYSNPTWCEPLIKEIKTKKGILPRHSPDWIKTDPVLWQDYLLWNKENIAIEGLKWNEVVKILFDIKDLFNVFFYATQKEVKKLKKGGWNKKFLSRDIFNNLIFNAGKFYAQKIKRAHPEMSEAIIRYWTKICAVQMERLNPFFKKSKERPSLLKLFKESDWLMPAAGFRNRRNEIQLANFYWRIADYLTFYLECLTGEKELSIEELTSPTLGGLEVSLKKQEKICEICGDRFIPNPKRVGGRPQILCGKENCNREWAKRHAKEYRKKKKLLNK